MVFCSIFRYIFRSEKKAGLQELGPRFTLKLRSLQKGSFDSKFGEYEFIHKVGMREFKKFVVLNFVVVSFHAGQI